MSVGIVGMLVAIAMICLAVHHRYFLPYRYRITTRVFRLFIGIWAFVFILNMLVALLPH